MKVPNLKRYDGKFNGENKIIFKNGNYIQIIYATWKIKLLQYMCNVFILNFYVPFHKRIIVFLQL